MTTFVSRFAALVLFVAAFATNGAFAQEAMAKADAAMSDKHTMKAETMMAKAKVTTVDLTQVPGEFTTTHLDLAAGQYTFNVTNKSVDHEVGFFIQKASEKDGAPGETALPNSFTTAVVATGETQSTGVVTLEPGEYVYSCPLNPTPHYTITVK